MGPDRPMAAGGRPAFDLLVQGGTVVTNVMSFQADVGVRDGQIASLEGPRGRDNALADAREVIDAAGLLVLPGVVDVHTHARLATNTEPDRFYADSVSAAIGGTTTFLAFNTPASDARPSASLLDGMREWRARTDGDSAVDHGLSPIITGTHADPVGEIPALVAAGLPTFKAFMVYDFRLADGTLLACLRAAQRHGGMLQVHCEDPAIIDAAVADELAAGHLAPRFHASSRPDVAEAAATHRAMAFARFTGAPIYVVHLSCKAALEQVRAAKGMGVQAFAETCPHYLALTSDRYEGDSATAARYVISPPLRTAMDRDALWVGLADGTLDVVGTDHVPDRVAIEKRIGGVPFDRISNGAPGIETLLAILYSEGVSKGRCTVERMVDLLATTPARLFGLERKGAIEVGRDADLVLFDPLARRTLRQADLHHTSDYTPYEGLELTGSVRTVVLRGRVIVRDGEFVGERGFGRFIERGRAGSR